MIRQDGDPAFWRGIADLPEVGPHVKLGTDFDIGALVSDPRVISLRAEHGGYIFVPMDGVGRCFDLHALFGREGWGREASLALKQALALMFERDAAMIVVSEVGGWWRSRPPRSFGFRPASDFAPVGALTIRTWFLTRDAWEGSLVRRRTRPCLQF